MIKTGGGAFNPKEENIYFIAACPGHLNYVHEIFEHILVAVNELKSQSSIDQLETWLGNGNKVFIDSGIFNLTNEHKRKHGISMDEALGLAPEEIDGFDELFNLYVELVEKYKDKCWGYIELDQGGRENKIKTRAKLEALGLRPIPVYHPLNDGWDYFDYLAQNYDRICFANVVQADRVTRKRLIATAWERHRKYPDLWIHLLGFTPNEWLYAMPINSGDSSSWMSSIRWSGYIPRICGKGFGNMPKDFQYEMGSDSTSEVGYIKAIKISAIGSMCLTMNWRNYVNRLEGLGFEVYPALSKVKSF